MWSSSRNGCTDCGGLVRRPRRGVGKTVLRGVLLFALLLPAAVLSARAAAAGVEVIGAGGSFPAPAMEAWADQFSRESGVQLLYRSVGSGEGILRVTARSADFALTDVPLTQAELVQDDLMQFPVIVGAIVPVLNVPGIGDGELRLTGAALADIYLGRITKWDDPVLKELNPQLALPALPIQVVHRADGSGSSFVFTYYLSRESSEWEQRLGIGSRLHWPAGQGARGNEGVSQTVHDTPGAIGYVEYTYAVQHQLVTARIRNRAGNFVRADETGVRAALASARWSRTGYYEVLADRDGTDSWPIVGISFALIHKKQEDRASATAILNFLHWVYAHPEVPRMLHYVPVEDAALIERIESSWDQVHDDEGRMVWKKRAGSGL
jgi:phosphate transport system substrate-binding protein